MAQGNKIVDPESGSLIAAAISNFRAHTGKSIATIAQESNFGEETIRAYIRGSRVPKPGSIAKLAAYLGVPAKAITSSGKLHKHNLRKVKPTTETTETIRDGFVIVTTTTRIPIPQPA